MEVPKLLKVASYCAVFTFSLYGQKINSTVMLAILVSGLHVKAYALI